jgi:ABC-type antimicrobial peptide transport system permease subunit
VFAGIALLLSAVGIYGVISYSVAQRTAEIGIRAALGASRGNLLTLILRQGFLMIGTGLTLGLCGRFWFDTSAGFATFRRWGVGPTHDSQQRFDAATGMLPLRISLQFDPRTTDLSLSISAFYFTILTATGLGALTGSGPTTGSPPTDRM